MTAVTIACVPRLLRKSVLKIFVDECRFRQFYVGYDATRRSFTNAAVSPVSPAAAFAPIPFKHIAVVGAGQMGTGIALTAARSSSLHLNQQVHVTLLDSSETQLMKSKAFAEKWTAAQVSKNKLTETQSQHLLSAIKFILMPISDGSTTTVSENLPPQILKSLESAEFCIEAAVESEKVKKRIFQFMDSVTPPNTILATNTSSISITKLASATCRPDQVVGMHFMNPVPVMELVEVISGLATSSETLEKVETLAAQLGKTTARSLDRPGFIANRLLMPYINEAVYALQEGIGTAQDIDKVMKLGTNVPMGPLTLADFIGLDTCLYIMRVLHTELADSKYRPSPLLVQYVDAGWLGRKSGRGFYIY